MSGFSGKMSGFSGKISGFSGNMSGFSGKVSGCSGERVGNARSGQVEATKCEDVVPNERVGKCQAVVLRTLLAQVCTPDVRFVKAPSVRSTRNCLH